jgi:hypothetical protein
VLKRDGLPRIADAVLRAVLKSDAAWSKAAAERIVQTLMYRFILDNPDERTWGDIWGDESALVGYLVDECVFELKMSDPGLADNPAVRLVKSIR